MKFFLRLFFLSITFSGLMMAATTGKIAGRVTDASGEPMAFVNVVITGSTMGAATDADGYYSILNIPPGKYNLKASAIGYSAEIVQGVRVSIDLTTTINFQLKESSLQLKQDIVVVATRPLVQKDLTATTSVVGDELIQSLPVTEVKDVLQLQAGITVSAGGDIHVRGGRKGQVLYQIDGVPVTDGYDGSTVVDLNSSSVKELQVISGAFNAEYGQAMSGVINLVTKDGDNSFKGSVSAYAGDYISSKSDVFWNIKKVNPLSIQNAEMSLSGPVVKDKLYFFTNLRYYYNEGYMYGKRDFLYDDIAYADQTSATKAWKFSQSGDGKYVPMNPDHKYFAQGKVTYNLMPGMKVSYNYILDREKYKTYDQNERLTPDNNLDRFNNSTSNIFTINHAISTKSFYTLAMSYYFKDYQSYLFKDIYTNDPLHPTQYVDNSARQTPPYSFAVGGTNANRFTRTNGTYAAKLDWSTQVTQTVNVQFGGEYKLTKLFYHNMNLIPKTDALGSQVTPFNVEAPSLTTQDNDIYNHQPMQGAAYAQAKVEAFNMILNIGLRVDGFDPDGHILKDPSDPNILNPLKPSNNFHDLNNNGVQDAGESLVTLAEREKYWYTKASVKYQISPRIGLAFPITDKGVLHFSYGHFLQLPSYEYLYTNPDFKLGVGSGNQGLFGNTDLKPQKTVKGEIGLQQQLGDDMSLDLTMFFEDFRDLTGTQTQEISVFGGAQSYSQYSNSDFGFSKGFIVKFAKNFGDGLAVNLDYTYSVTKGNASNPADARNAALGGALPETFIAPLDWDQEQTLNLSLSYSKPQDYGFSIIGNFYSGQPYTPAVNQYSRISQNAFPRNSDTKPTQFKVDLRAYKDIMIGNNTLTFFVKVFNLLDLDNATSVYSDTGDPTFTLDKYNAEVLHPVLYYNSLDDLYTNPSYFSEPRRVELGFSYNF